MVKIRSFPRDGGYGIPQTCFAAKETIFQSCLPKRNWLSNRYPQYKCVSAFKMSQVMLLRLASIYRVTTDYILGRQKTDLLDISDLSQREVSVMQELAELLGEKYK